MKDLRELRYFLGLDVTIFESGIVTNHRKYALELIIEVGLLGAKTSKTPMELNQHLTSVAYDKTLELKNNDSVLFYATFYRRLIGKLLDFTMTRHNTSFVVHYLSQFMQAPKQSGCYLLDYQVC